MKQRAPGLLDDFEAHESLTVVDDYYSRRTILARTGFYFVVSTPFFTTVFLCAGLDLLAKGKGTILEAIVFPSLLSIVLNLIVYGLFVGGGLLMIRNPHSNLTVSNGAVSYSVRDNRCMAGRWEDFLYRVYPWNADARLPWRTPILVLIYRKDGFLRRTHATVALTQEMYNHWISLLALTAD